MLLSYTPSDHQRYLLPAIRLRYFECKRRALNCTNWHTFRRIIMGLPMQPAGSWYPSEQVFHLIRQDMPVPQNEVFMPGRRVRHIQQRHARLFRRAIRFSPVAGPARCNHVHPNVLATLRNRDHMVARQVACAKTITAVRAQMTIAHIQ